MSIDLLLHRDNNNILDLTIQNGRLAEDDTLASTATTMILENARLPNSVVNNVLPYQRGGSVGDLMMSTNTTRGSLFWYYVKNRSLQPGIVSKIQNSISQTLQTLVNLNLITNLNVTVNLINNSYVQISVNFTQNSEQINLLL